VSAEARGEKIFCAIALGRREEAAAAPRPGAWLHGSVGIVEPIERRGWLAGCLMLGQGRAPIRGKVLAVFGEFSFRCVCVCVCKKTKSTAEKKKGRSSNCRKSDTQIQKRENKDRRSHYVSLC
jgi:hypothetical protein